MYKKLYREDYESLNEEGGQLDKEIYDTLSPIIKKWTVDGYSTLEMENLVKSVVDNIIILNRASRACTLSKSRRN